MNFTQCPTFTEYISLWLTFPGDPALLAEMIEHKAKCPTCQANMANWLDLEAKKVTNVTIHAG